MQSRDVLCVLFGLRPFAFFRSFLLLLLLLLLLPLLLVLLLSACGSPAAILLEHGLLLAASVQRNGSTAVSTAVPRPVRQRHLDGAGLGDFARQVGPLSGRQVGVAHQRGSWWCLVGGERGTREGGGGGGSHVRGQEEDILNIVKILVLSATKRHQALH